MLYSHQLTGVARRAEACTAKRQIWVLVGQNYDIPVRATGNPIYLRVAYDHTLLSVVDLSSLSSGDGGRARF